MLDPTHPDYADHVAEDRAAAASIAAARRPKAKRANPERSLQVALLRWLRLALPAGAFPFAIENERASRSMDRGQQARFQMARRASGTVAGMPDIQVVLHNGRVVWLELKAPAGRLSEHQHGIHERLRSLGHVVGVARSIGEAAAVLREAHVPLRASVP